MESAPSEAAADSSAHLGPVTRYARCRRSDGFARHRAGNRMKPPSFAASPWYARWAKAWCRSDEHPSRRQCRSGRQRPECASSGMRAVTGVARYGAHLRGGGRVAGWEAFACIPKDSPHRRPLCRSPRQAVGGEAVAGPPRHRHCGSARGRDRSDAWRHPQPPLAADRETCRAASVAGTRSPPGPHRRPRARPFRHADEHGEQTCRQRFRNRGIPSLAARRELLSAARGDPPPRPGGRHQSGPTAWR